MSPVRHQTRYAAAAALLRTPKPVRGSIGCLLLALTSFAPAACGADANGDSAADAREAGSGIALAVCDVLNGEEVAQVLPDHDGGVVVASGGSIFEGVDRYQCSYTAYRNEQRTDFDLFNVVVATAAESGQLDPIRRDFAELDGAFEIFREAGIGEAGYLYGERDELMIDAWREARLVSIELVADGAADHADRLVALADSALARVGRSRP